MMHATLKIICVGENAADRKRLTDVLAQAGYDVTARRAGVRQLRGLANTSQVVILTARRRLSRRASTHGGSSRERGERAAEPVVMNLRGLREAVGRTQGDVARSASMSQPQLSRVEARTDHLISTLRKYVRALGGDIELIVRLGKDRILLRGV